MVIAAAAAVEFRVYSQTRDIIRPASHACWPLAEMIRIRAWQHLSMLWNRQVADDILRRIDET
jgi:hypothetical protein